MHFVLWEGNGNNTDSVRKYCRLPEMEHFTKSDRKLAVHIQYVMRTWNWWFLKPSTDSLPSSLHRTLWEQQLQPYLIQPVHELIPQNAPTRPAFRQRILQLSAEDPTFRTKVLFTDKLCFTGIGITNIHHFSGATTQHTVFSCQHLIYF
jgi:hypothetical protein